MLKEYITFMILLLLIDSLWIMGASKLHTSVVQKVQKSPLKVNYIPAFLFYIIASLGFVLIIQKLSHSVKEAFQYGLILGLLMYGTFDLTNKAIFVDYPWWYTMADMTWGTLVVGIVSALTYKITV